MTRSIGELREELPSLQGGAYFNTGYCGPLPIGAATAMREELERDLTVPRGRADAFDHELRLASEAKTAFASVFANAQVGDIALTDSTSHGLGLVIAGLGLKPGDEIITTDEEHFGLGAVLAAAAGWGAELVLVPFGSDDLPGAIERSITPRTRAVALSHLSYVSGLASDPRSICQRIPDSIPLVIDGAHTPGCLAFDPGESGIAAIAFPAQKWCLGPEGVGGLWVSRRWQDEIRPTVVSFRSMAEWISPTNYQFEAGAARYDSGTFNKPVVACLIEAIRFLNEEVGLDRAIAATQLQADKVRKGLAEIDGVSVISPPGTPGGLVGFRVRGIVNCEVEAARLWERGIRLRRIENPPGLRASVAWFNTDREIDLLFERVAEGVGTG